MAAEAKWVTKEKVVMEAKQAAEEKAVAEVEEHQRVAEVEARRIAEEKAMAAVRWQAILDVEARCQAKVEEVVTEPDGGLLLKQKERAEGESVMCDHCTTREAEFQVSDQSSSPSFADGG